MSHEVRIPLDEEFEQILAEVQELEGLSSIDQTAEFLLRKRLNHNVQSLTGRPRALYLVKGGRQCA